MYGWKTAQVCFKFPVAQFFLIKDEHKDKHNFTRYLHELAKFSRAGGIELSSLSYRL